MSQGADAAAADDDDVKKALQFSAKSVTFRHRHENKSCSTCPEDQLEPLKFSKF